jgi:hypothetical protein
MVVSKEITTTAMTNSRRKEQQEDQHDNSNNDQYNNMMFDDYFRSSSLLASCTGGSSSGSSSNSMSTSDHDRTLMHSNQHYYDYNVLYCMVDQTSCTVVGYHNGYELCITSSCRDSNNNKKKNRHCEYATYGGTNLHLVRTVFFRTAPCVAFIHGVHGGLYTSTRRSIYRRRRCGNCVFDTSTIVSPHTYVKQTNKYCYSSDITSNCIVCEIRCKKKV